MRFLERFIAETLSTMGVTASLSSLHNSFNKFINHAAWHAHNEVAIYTNSQEESVTTSSFFEHHEIDVSSNIKMHLVVDFLSSLSPHQLKLVYPSILHFMPLSIAENEIPQLIEPLMYLRILLTTVKWETFYFSMNLLTILTLKAKSGLVFHK